MFSIIIPVHNHPEFLAPCLNSLLKHTLPPYRVTVVDDGSDDKTFTALQAMRIDGYIDVLLRNDTPLGFSAACNRGLRAVEADYYCLLNSDTQIGTPGWNDRIIEALDALPEIGLASVLSNAALNQSIPSPGPLLPGYTPESFAAVIDAVTENRNPASRLIHGFCYIFTKAVFKKMGLLDEKKYPHYGSEDEYTFKAVAAGFQGVIVDSVFVYHHNAGSYQDTRTAIVAETGPQFLAEWGAEAVQRIAQEAFDSLGYLRVKVLAWVKNPAFLAMFCLKPSAGKPAYIGADGFPVSWECIEFFKGTKAEIIAEAGRRLNNYCRLFMQNPLEHKMEYQMHQFVSGAAEIRLLKSIRKHFMDKHLDTLPSGRAMFEANKKKAANAKK
jgi:GT2 family glycosyltransferase